MKASLNFVLVLLLSLSASSLSFANFNYELFEDLNDMDIDLQVVSSTGRTMSINIENFDDREAYCVVTFKNGPETKRIKRRRLEPRRETLFVNRARRPILRLIVFVSCEQYEEGIEGRNRGL